MRTPAHDPMTHLTPDQVGRLPRYALAELARLTHALATAQAALDDRESGRPGNIVAHPNSAYPHTIGDDDLTVEYAPAPDVAIQVRFHDAHVTVSATGPAALTLSVTPRAGNSIDAHARTGAR